VLRELAGAAMTQMATRRKVIALRDLQPGQLVVVDTRTDHAWPAARGVVLAQSQVLATVVEPMRRGQSGHVEDVPPSE
jgi:hypothetical protein